MASVGEVRKKQTIVIAENIVADMTRRWDIELVDDDIEASEWTKEQYDTLKNRVDRGEEE